MSGRAVKEWIGKSADSAIPPRVSLRVLELHNHRCYLSGVEIREGDHWQVEHRLALSLGGENRESNLAPVLIEPHKIKTRADMKLKAKGARIRKKRFGLAKPKQIMPGSRRSPWKHKLGRFGRDAWERRA